MTKKNVKVVETQSKFYTVELSLEEIHQIIRDHVGAPSNATVWLDSDDWCSHTFEVTWREDKVVEYES